MIYNKVTIPGITWAWICPKCYILNYPKNGTRCGRATCTMGDLLKISNSTLSCITFLTRKKDSQIGFTTADFAYLKNVILKDLYNLGRPKSKLYDLL